MKKPSETKSEFHCEFCNKSFQREQSFFAHSCTAKKRWQERDNAGNRIGFQAWSEFYKRNTASRKQKTYIDFAKSAYYLAFVRFGTYCVEIKCVSVISYQNWLLDNKIRVDDWCKDTNYDKFLISHLKDEDPLSALARSIETTMDLAEIAGIQCKDCLRYGNVNRILQKVINGKISPWMLYQCESGIKFIEQLNEPQQNMIMEYINPEQWTLKFRRNPEFVTQIKELLRSAGY